MLTPDVSHCHVHVDNTCHKIMNRREFNQIFVFLQRESDAASPDLFGTNLIKTILLLLTLSEIVNKFKKRKRKQNY